ncbi:hypothetical protein JTE90_007602 [Oedothorax gibbosus]|uniref:Uncharacterized protein n=1 Tax=Oedothorax gibbosus TaxID=931172 RepID=A0AAV6TJA9_9ARAC|nr:hypothetical protein JTE90_007602 [Oedothorax gibbosus]
MGTVTRHENYTISLGFSRANRGHRTPQRRVLLRDSVPISRTSRFQDTSSYKEKITLPRSSVDVSEFGCVYRTLSEGPISVSGLGIYNPIPFGRQRDKPSMCCAFRVRLVFGTDFSEPLGPTDPCSLLFNGTFPPASVLRLSLEYVLLPPRAATRWRLPAGSARHLQTHATATLLLTAAETCHGEGSARSGPVSPRWSVIHFSWLCFGR